VDYSNGCLLEGEPHHFPARKEKRKTATLKIDMQRETKKKKKKKKTAALTRGPYQRVGTRWAAVVPSRP